ncbi:supervillin-like, partial [Pollicipes pollicipes]|uniref:supervillin-like n=1 Tax=Pollicipes pollicipes TaxID=41117 RepID=UPI0018854AC3
RRAPPAPRAGRGVSCGRRRGPARRSGRRRGLARAPSRRAAPPASAARKRRARSAATWPISCSAWTRATTRLPASRARVWRRSRRTSPAARGLASVAASARARWCCRSRRRRPGRPSRPESDSTPPEIRRTGGIKDRLAALQKSGEDDWRRRIRSEEPKLALVEAFNSGLHTDVVLRKKVVAVTTPASDRPVSHIERMSGALQLTATEGWKARVPENDANKFTVAGKMGQAASPGASPMLPRRQLNAPKQVVFRSKTGTRREAQSMYVESSTTKVRSSLITQRQNSDPSEDTARPASVLVTVPELADASFDSFFGSAPAAGDEPAADWSALDWDLDAVARGAELPAGAARVRVRRRARSSRNPVRALSARADLLTQYEEVRLGVGEHMIKMAKKEELSRKSTFAQESLAGLATKLDFSAIKLGRRAVPDSMLPYRREPMLLRVKGRRHVQTRLVRPCVQALNTGDCFLLVTPDQVFQWCGYLSNVIEQSKAADVALHVARTHDLGCSANKAAAIEYHENGGGVKGSRREETKFFELLGGRADVPKAGSPDEDELYEAAVAATNKVYQVTADEELVPVPDAWGQIPKCDMLQDDKVFVFDFGAELYLWTGRLAGKPLRDAGKRLTRELWDAGYDYSDCEHPPIDGAPAQGPRPDWGILGRVGQNMETILFREKFLDWNDPSRMIKVKPDSDPETELAPPLELAPCDAAAMVATHHPEPDLVLEMEHLGRGTHFSDEEERRQLEISTVSVKTWHVNEAAATQLEAASAGQLHQGDTYVVQWVYQVTQTGRRLGGGASKHLSVGRQRCAYFFWQGASSTVNEKGASALMVIELDQERGPQVRVTQGREPAAFLQLFAGRLAEGGSLPAPPRAATPATPRLFHFSCGSGRFHWAAVPCLHCSSERPCALPYTQRELYERQQPALLLLDAGHVVYVWQGWRPPADPDAGQAAALAGAATFRWHEERRCALQTAVEYSRLRGRLPCRLVVAGLEPTAFQHMFPVWQLHPEAARLNTELDYSAGFERPAADVLKELTRSVYPLAVLRERPLPDGVDPVRLEAYLSDAEFAEVLKMPRDKFNELPAWRKKDLKKEADLF